MFRESRDSRPERRDFKPRDGGFRGGDRDGERGGFRNNDRDGFRSGDRDFRGGDRDFRGGSRDGGFRGHRDGGRDFRGDRGDRDFRGGNRGGNRIDGPMCDQIRSFAEECIAGGRDVDYAEIAMKIGADAFAVKKKWENWLSQPEWSNEDVARLTATWDSNNADTSVWDILVTAFDSQRSLSGIKAKLQSLSSRDLLSVPYRPDDSDLADLPLNKRVGRCFGEIIDAAKGAARDCNMDSSLGGVDGHIQRIQDVLSKIRDLAKKE